MRMCERSTTTTHLEYMTGKNKMNVANPKCGRAIKQNLLPNTKNQPSHKKMEKMNEHSKTNEAEQFNRI